ncbi:MAG: hypothetical protein COB20_11140 [SAR86 cluster bacterium]|uniref:Uncharacterized protein n=1 Tax=SAR86 cluster bacterium TaxID=2030880 RepID=A0A2A4X0V7_9GAMM|nr:MAG: hypothetical protein COB20_11140 [SAR86 cluster bacterium]
MNAAEWIEFSSMASSNSYTSFAMLLTFASGYLAASYIVGSKLTTLQVILSNFVFISAYTFFALNAYGNLLDWQIARSMAAESVPEIQVFSSNEAAAFVMFAVLVYIGVLLVCLKFMWDIRHREN